MFVAVWEDVIVLDLVLVCVGVVDRDWETNTYTDKNKYTD